MSQITIPLNLVFFGFLSCLALAAPAITPSEVVSPPAYLSLQIYRGGNSRSPCTGVNGTLHWLVSNTMTTPNTTAPCFSAHTHYLTCIQRNFQQFDNFQVDTTPRSCSVEGFQQSDCEGSGVEASYNGATEWTWYGEDEATDVQSFRMDCVAVAPA